MKKKTLKQLHGELKSLPVTKRNAVLDALDVKAVQVFYDLLENNRKISEREKTAIAAVYEVDQASIDWKDEKNLPE